MPFVAAVLALCLFASPARAETTISVRAGTSGFEFGFLYSDHYHTNESVVRHYVERLDESDFVVALHLARLSGIELDIIVGWRQEGASWWEITHRCHLGPEVYYVELEGDPGPPYGRAWGHWKKNPKKVLVLQDDEIRAFTVLKAMSEYTGQSPTQIVVQRKEGRSPEDIARASKKSGKAKVEDASSPVPKPGKAKQTETKQKKGKGKK